jgi:hypothetical protein
MIGTPTPGAPPGAFTQPGTAVDRDGLAGSPAEMIAERPTVETMSIPDVNAGQVASLKAHRDGVSGMYREGGQVEGQPPHHDVTRFDLGSPQAQESMTHPRSQPQSAPNAMEPAADAKPAASILNGDITDAVS